MHSGPECSFCEKKRQNPIDLGWERLLEDSSPSDTEFNAGDDRMENLLSDKLESILSQYDAETVEAATIESTVSVATTSVYCHV